MKKYTKTKQDLEKAVLDAGDGGLDTAVETDKPDVADEAVVVDAAEVVSRLEAAEKQANDNLDRYQRTLAEFDNFRKRTVKEKASMYDDGASDLALGLLPVIDNFERAFAAATEGDKETAFYKGTQLIYRQLTEYLASKNITAIQALGEAFNPELHAAVAHVDDENYGDGEIIEDMQKGYKYKDKVLRHSVVKVAN